MLKKVLNKVQKVLVNIGIFTLPEEANKDLIVTEYDQAVQMPTANDLPDNSNSIVQVLSQEGKKVITEDLSNVESYIEKFAKQNADFSEISKEKLYEFADNVELTEFFSKLSDERLKELLSELNPKANVKAYSKAENFTYVEEKPNHEASSYSDEQHIPEVDPTTLRDMFKQYAFHNVIQGLNDQDKFSELVKHLNDVTLYIPNYINKGYQTDINGKDISGDTSPLQIES